MPEVSIIIPVHNRTYLLQQTLASCFIQTHRDLEVIVVDDGSTEDVAKVAEDAPARFEVSSPVRYIRQAHLGANAARNRGVKEAAGQFIQFVDSDDLLHPHKIETQRNVLVGMEDMDMVFGLDQWFRVRPGDMSLLWNKPNDVSNLGRFLWGDPVWHTGSPLWRRSALDRIGPWNERLSCWQDWEFHIRALCRGIKHIHVPVILQYLRNHKDTRISDTESLRGREQSKLEAAIAVADELKRARIWTPEAGDALATFSLGIAMSLRWVDALDLIRHALTRAEKYSAGSKLGLTTGLMRAALLVSRLVGINYGYSLGLAFKIARNLGLIPQHKRYWSTMTHEQGDVPSSLLQALDVVLVGNGHRAHSGSIALWWRRESGARFEMELMSNEGPRDFTVEKLLETVVAAIRPRRSNDPAGVEDLQRRLDPSELSRMCLYSSLIPRPVSADARLVHIGGTVFWLPLYLSLGYQHITVVVRPGHGFFDEFELVRQREFTLEIVEADGNLDPYPIESGSATVVVCFEVLEHLAGDPMHLIAESNRILAAGGSLCLVTPNVLWHQNVLSIVLGQHPFTWSVFTASDADRHNRQYTPFEVRWLLEAGGYRVDDLHTIAFHKPNWQRRVLGRLLCMPAALTKRVSFALREEVTLVHAQKIGPVKDRYPEFLNLPIWLRCASSF